MSNWNSCINENCFSFVYYSSNGNVQSNCTGAMQVTPESYDSITPETKLFDLSCDATQTSVVATGPDQFRIDDKYFSVPPSYGRVAAMKVEIGRMISITNVAPSAGSPLIVRAEFDPPLQQKGATTGSVRSKLERFENASAYEKWKGSLGETKVSGIPYYLNSANGSNTTIVVKFNEHNLLQTVINGPEAFIVGPNDANGVDASRVIEGRGTFKEYLSKYAGNEDFTLEVLYLANGATPQMLKGRPAELAAFADMLVEETKDKGLRVSRGPKLPPEWDVGVRISAPQGLRNDHNYIAESKAFNEWAPEFKQDFQDNMTNERGRYYTPATGFSVSGHYLFNPTSWAQIGLGVEDELAWREGTLETANSELFSNTLSTSIPIRVGDPELVFLALKPADIGWMSASGQTTLKDQSVKHDTSIDAFVWQPGAGIGTLPGNWFDLESGDKFGFEAGYRYRIFAGSSIPLEPEHVVQFGAIFYFGGSEGEGVAEEQSLTPAPLPQKAARVVDTLITEQEAIIPGVPAFTPVELGVTPWETASETETFNVDSNQLKMISISNMRGNYRDINVRIGESSDRVVNPGVYRIVNKVEEYSNFLKSIGMSQPKVKIPISAHSDSSGSKEHNEKLSAERGENFINTSQLGSAGLGLLHELNVRGLSGILDSTPTSEVFGEEMPVGYQCKTFKKCSADDLPSDTRFTKPVAFDVCDRSGKKEKCEEMNLYAPCFDKDGNPVKDPRVASSKKYSLDSVKYGGYCQVNLGRTKTSYLENFQAARRVNIKIIALTLPAYKGVVASLPSIETVQVGGFSLYKLPLTGTISTSDIPPINNADITNLVGLVKKFATDAGNEVTVAISLPDFVGNNYLQKWIGAAVAENTQLSVKVVFSNDPELTKQGIILTVGARGTTDHTNEDLRRAWSEMFKR